MKDPTQAKEGPRRQPQRRWLFAAALLATSTTALAQYGGYHYNHLGQLVDQRGTNVNQHQELHDLLNPKLWTTGAVAVSNTVDPNYTQATLTDIEAAMVVTTDPGELAMSRLYLTPTNPYTAGTGLISGAPPADNHTHYEQILLDASTGGYQSTLSGAYIAKTSPSSSSKIFNRGFHSYEASPKFLAAKEAAGGLGGGIVFFVNQSAESFAHLRVLSGSNMFMTAYVRPYAGAAIALGGQVVLNQQHNTNAALDTNQYGPAFVAGVGQIQDQTLNSGNEAGFWLTGSGGTTGISFWEDGSPNSIRTTYDPNAQFHVHTHLGNTGPSLQDMLTSAQYGLPGAVYSDNGSYAYGFQLEGGILPTTDGVLIFNDRWGTNGYPGIEATRVPSGPTRGSVMLGWTGEVTLGQGLQGTGAVVAGFDDRGNLNVGVYGSGQVTGGYLGGSGPVVGASSTALNTGTNKNPVATTNVGIVGASGSLSIDLSNPGNVSGVRGGPAAMVGASIGVGVEGTAATTAISGQTMDSITNSISSAWGTYGSTLGATYGNTNNSGSSQNSSANVGANDSGTGSGRNSGYSSGSPSSSNNPANSGSFGSPGY